jgi:hypothetical protein
MMSDEEPRGVEGPWKPTRGEEGEGARGADRGPSNFISYHGKSIFQLLCLQSQWLYICGLFDNSISSISLSLSDKVKIILLG